MSQEKVEADDGVAFEAALDQTGFGLYNYWHTFLTGLIIIGFVFMAYSTAILLPASACELETTTAQQGLLGAMPILGSIIGAFVWGYLGDTRGRRNVMMWCIVVSVFLNSLASISVNWVMLLLFQFVTTFVSSGQYTLSVTLISESVPLAHRNKALLLVSSMFLLSQGLMSVLAIPIIPLRFSYYLPALGIYWNSWRTLMVTYSLPSMLSFVGLWFIYESPKFLLLKGDEQKALDVLRAIHSINNRGSGKVFQVKRLLPEEDVDSKEKKLSKDQFIPLFKPPLLKTSLLVMSLALLQHVGSFTLWFPTLANLIVDILETGEGADLNVCGMIDLSRETPADPDAVPCSLNETALLIVLAVGAMQSLVNFIVSLVIDRTGRRNMAMGVVTVIGTCGILVNLIPNAIASFIIFGIFLVGIITQGIYTAVAVAQFPTHLRAMAVSLFLACNRVSSFVSIQILNVLLVRNCEAGFYTFASVILLQVVVASRLPDDRRLGKLGAKPESSGSGS